MRSPSWLGRANSLWLRRPRKMRRTASARGARRRLSPRQCLNLSSSISARPAALGPGHTVLMETEIDFGFHRLGPLGADLVREASKVEWRLSGVDDPIRP